MAEHGDGLDAPLGVVRMEYSDELHDAQVIAPHATRRGTYDRGTPITGQCLVYSSNGKMLALQPHCHACSNKPKEAGSPGF